MARIAVAGLVVLLVPCVATAESKDAREIVAKHLEACGGAARLRAVNSIREAGTMSLTGPGGWTGPFVLEEKRPNKSRSERTIGGIKVIRAFDGSTGWMLRGANNRAEVLDESTSREMAENDFDSDLLDYETRGIGVTLVGTIALKTGPAYKLKVSKRGAVHYSYLDLKSFLEVRRDYVESNGSITQQTFQGHMVVAGVMRPTMYVTGQDGDPRRLVVQVQKVEVNPVVPDGRFRMPEHR